MNRFLSKPLSLIIGYLIVATSLCACRGNEVENVDLKSIRDCKELEVAEFHFHKIIVERRTVSALRIAGFGIASFPERTLILPVDVTVVGKIDFSNVAKDNLIHDGDKVVFTLPDPTLRIVSIQRDDEMRGKASREQWYRGGGFSDEEIQKIEEQAKDSIMIDRTLEKMAERTRVNAASVLIPLISSATGVSEDKISVQFNSDLNRTAATLKDDDTIIFRKKE
ncbi:MAG: DUF4230 domain-containing protein [Prevotella sp.]|nr:DUF4230 domain-containing protein [Prevotella sp.]